MHASDLNTVVRGFAVALVVAGLGLALPSSAQAGGRAERGGVIIDDDGVHLYQASVHHYSHDRYPRARRYFEANDHVRKIQRLQAERRQLLRRAWLMEDLGRYGKARKYRRRARKLERRREHQLALLEADRIQFEKRFKPRRHARAERRRHRHHHDHHRWSWTLSFR